MKGKASKDEGALENFEVVRNDFQKWAPLFSRLGLNPRRYLKRNDAVFICTAEGWFRLSPKKFEKQELQWIKSILEYLNERSFVNWAVPWQKTIVWEENNSCYLIQPWYFAKEGFLLTDPASIRRIAEVLADLYRCGKDYRENKGIEIFRERWSTIDLQWELSLKSFEDLKEDNYHEKIRKEVHDLKKEAINLINDCLTIWRNGISNLFDHHLQSGVISHGRLIAANIVWKDNDYYLLDWENLSFQPKIADLATFINDIGVWEPEWIVFLINEYSKIQPFWPEEYNALKAMLQYPFRLINLLNQDPEEMDHKVIKEVNKEMKRKDRCLEKVWRELGNEKRWNKGRGLLEKSTDNGKISMVLSPVETWGGFENDPFNSLIRVKTEEKLPNDIYERLVNESQNQVFAGGREGNIMEAAAKNDDGIVDYLEIVEEQPKQPEEKMDFLKIGAESDLVNEVVVPQKTIIDSQKPIDIIKDEREKPKEKQTMISWGNFPKPLNKSAAGK